uniref:Protein bric-a-brac 2 n=1 Tax=Glossina morsitans morsitans TaxID=37546 RepID=A0A1B0GCQ4_GLOMM
MNLTKNIMDFTVRARGTDLVSLEATDELCAANHDSTVAQNSEAHVEFVAPAGVELSRKTAYWEREKLRNPSTPELLENMDKSITKATTNCDLTPPPRPLTSSEVVGFTSTFEDPDINVEATLALKKSRSLPASPNHLANVRLTPLFAFTSRKAFEPPKIAETYAINKEPRTIKQHFETDKRNNQQFCLRWNNYQNNLTNVFDELLQNESFVDVTLACEGQSIKAHKVVLSACSPYFQRLFYDNPCQHPIVIMRDVRWQELKALMEFMYKGEINVSQDQINPLLKVAEMLKIRGLAEVNSTGTAAAHPMVLEQRMAVYESDEEKPVENDEPYADGEDITNRQKAKRPRINDTKKIRSKLDINFAPNRTRKRSRDGLLMDTDRFFSSSSHNDTYDYSKSSTGNFVEKNVPSSVPTAMTTSTIVRNPFASPNQTNQASDVDAKKAFLTSSLASSHSAASSDASSSSVTLPFRSMTRSCSPSLAAATHTSREILALVSPTESQTSAHSRSAGSVGNALADPNHPHHQAVAAAQHLAAQHQFHTAAQSHAVMASALGVSLAAVAAGASSASGITNNTGKITTGPPSHHDDMEIKPEIAEMIREEERAKMIESGHPWTAGTSSTSVTDSYQYQLQSMWQKCWNTNQQNLVQQLRFRERGPLKSWRPEAMAEAIFSVLKEGLSLSQAARKYDIPYPTFVLYANRVHNMLGPSLDGGSDPRPKARGRPQRILLGMWPDDLIRSVIKAVVFRDYREIKDELGGLSYVNGQPNVPPHFSNPNTIITNGMHNAAKLAVQNTILASQESSSPLNSMTENFRRHIISQQQQHSPVSQNMNLYKSPAYLQRSEMSEQSPDLLSKQMSERRSAENLADLSKLGLMNLSGLNALPPSGPCPNQSIHHNANTYTIEREMECSREKERDHKLKEAIQARQFGNCSRGSATGASDGQKQAPPSCFSTGPSSPYPYFKNKDHAIQYAYNKKFLENLPPGIDFEAIANGLFQKSAVKSPRFEDLFSGQDGNELLPTNETGVATAFPSQRDSNLMQIKLEQQQITEMQNEG